MPPEREGSIKTRLAIWSNMANATLKTEETAQKSAHTFTYAFKRISDILLDRDRVLETEQEIVYWQTLTTFAPRHITIIKDEKSLALLRNIISLIRRTFEEDPEDLGLAKIQYLISLAPQKAELDSTAFVDCVRVVVNEIKPDANTPKDEAKGAADLIGAVCDKLVAEQKEVRQPPTPSK